MNNKKGMTLSMLIIYIMVMLILAGVIVSNFLGSDSLTETVDAVFISRMNDYIDEYNATKNYCIINDISTALYVIDNYIPSISVADKEFLTIQSGNLVYIREELTPKKITALQNLGLTEFIN